MSQTDPAQTYRQEAAELLEQLEQCLLDLEHAPGDMDLVNTAFRALHTIKGSGAMFGFDRVAAFTHHVETAFDLVRQGKTTASAGLIAVTLAAKDHIRRLIETPSEVAETAGEAIIEQLRATVGLPVSADASAGPATVEGAQVAGAAPPALWRLRFQLPRNAMAMGTNPLLLLDELRGQGGSAVRADTSRIPPLEELDPTECHIAWEVTLAVAQPREVIEQVFLFVMDGMQIELEPISGAGDLSAAALPIAAAMPSGAAVPPGAAASRGVALAIAATLPSGAAASRGVAVPPGATDPPPAKTPSPAVRLVPPRSTAAPPQHGEVHTTESATSIRVPAERLDELMDRVGELVIAQSRLKQVASASNDPQVKSVAEEIERLALELRDSTMGARMVPIGQLFGRFRRLVHDLGRDLGKDIALVTEGEETELDKTLIERLGDPLIHLIRNSADHGLESPEQRLAAGKPAQGRIILAARHLGHEVLISISDDGRGLDRGRIRQRAEEQGLLSPEARPSDAELFQVLFQAGFSTAREITSVSGRGVGMDVVRRAIESLRGHIDITSPPDDGTRVTLHLPLTLAIIDGLLIRVGNGRYVIPLSAIEECVALSMAEDTRSQGHNFLNIRGDIVPFLRLRELFGCQTPPDQFQKVVIVSSAEQRVGLVVDQVIGDHQTVIKSLSRLHADAAAFSGATILGDGAVALILEVAHLVGHGRLRTDHAIAAE